MYKKVIIVTLVFSILIFITGCNHTNTTPQIKDFTIQYLDIQDNKLIVNNDVTIGVDAPKASNVQLYVQDYGQEKVEKVIDGKKFGTQWKLNYNNNNPFTKEIWVVAYYNDREIATEKKVITNQTQSYESVFESIIPMAEDSMKGFSLIKQKVDLKILGWLGEQKILAQEENNLIAYDFDHKKREILIENGWNIYPNLAMKKVIYQDSSGLNVFDVQSGDKKQIFKPKDNQLIKDLAWSRSNKEVILHIVEDKREEFYLINLQTSKVNTIDNIGKEEYTLEQLIYLDSGYLFALGNLSVGEGDGGEGEITTGILAINIYSGKVKNFTPNLQTMDEISILSQINENEFLVRLTSKVMSEEELLSENNIYLLNTQSRKLKMEKNNIDFPYVYHLSPKKDSSIYLKNPINDEEKLNGKIIVLGEGASKEREILKAAPYYPKSFYWSPSGKKILFYIDDIQELYCIQKES